MNKHDQKYGFVKFGYSHNTNDTESRIHTYLIIETLNELLTQKGAVGAAPPLSETNHAKEEIVPKFLALDKKVLRFYGYFKESLSGNTLESYRIRR